MESRALPADLSSPEGPEGAAAPWQCPSWHGRGGGCPAVCTGGRTASGLFTACPGCDRSCASPQGRACSSSSRHQLGRGRFVPLPQAACSWQCPLLCCKPEQSCLPSVEPALQCCSLPGLPAQAKHLSVLAASSVPKALRCLSAGPGASWGPPLASLPCPSL